MDNSQKIMRLVFVGLCQSALSRLYREEEHRLNEYWEDLEAKSEEPRQTIIGNFVLCLLYHLPTLRNYTANMQEHLHLIYYFCRLGT